jgi:hypothetical protein
LPSGYEGGRREKQGDFVGFVPSNSSKTRRPDAITFDYLTAFCPGPIANGDSSGGAAAHAWRCRVENPSAFDFTGKVYISRANDARDAWGPEEEIFTFTGENILEVDIAFEQAGRPVICAERNTGVDGSPEVWLYWFDSTDSMFGFDNFGAGRTPRVILDNPLNVTESDVLFFYLTSTELAFRQQRDRYAIVYNTPLSADANTYIEDVVKLRDGRVKVEIVRRDVATGKYLISGITSTLYPILVGDTSYIPDLSFISALMIDVVINDTLKDIDAFDTDLLFLSAILAEPVILNTLYDKDSFDTNLSFVSAILAQPVILKTLYDKDGFDPTLGYRSATLVVVVIVQTLFDKDKLDVGLGFQSATLVTV